MLRFFYKTTTGVSFLQYDAKPMLLSHSEFVKMLKLIWCEWLKSGENHSWDNDPRLVTTIGRTFLTPCEIFVFLVSTEVVGPWYFWMWWWFWCLIIIVSSWENKFELVRRRRQKTLKTASRRYEHISYSWHVIWFLYKCVKNSLILAFLSSSNYCT